jgi:hypothetical protein
MRLTRMNLKTNQKIPLKYYDFSLLLQLHFQLNFPNFVV